MSTRRTVQNILHTVTGGVLPDADDLAAAERQEAARQAGKFDRTRGSSAAQAERHYKAALKAGERAAKLSE